MAEDKKLPPPEDHDEDVELGGHMSFIEHLEELRVRIIRMIVVLAVCTLVSFAFSGYLLQMLIAPAEDVDRLQKLSDLLTGMFTPVVEYFSSSDESEVTGDETAIVDVDPEAESYRDEAGRVRFNAQGPLVAFMAKIKISIVAGIFIGFPYFFYEIWRFVSPGLYKREKRFIFPTVISTWFCFVCGGLFAYFLVLPIMIAFMSSLAAGAGIENIWSIDIYLNNALHLVLAFGVIFEEPVVIALLAKMGLVTAASLRKARSYVIVGMFVLGAIVTPPDPTSQLICAFPLILLYEMSILMVGLFRPKDDTPAEQPA